VDTVCGNYNLSHSNALWRLKTIKKPTILKTYCINLARRVDRKKNMVEQFKKLPGHDIEFIEAVDAKTLNNKPPNFPTVEQYATGLSHIRCIEKALQQNLPMVMICEDDIVFSDDAELRIKRLVENAPDDAEMLYIGFTPMFNHPVYYHVSENIVRLENNCSGAWCYIVKASMYERILQDFNSPEAWEIDNLYWSYHKEGHCYSMMPFCSYTADGFSDNANKQMQWPKIKELYKETL
jgi:GR25 family glycosyltransferase involved in LPS biosynthesis